MNKTIGLLAILVAMASSSAYASDCPITIKVADVMHDADGGLNREEATLLKEALVNELKSKGYQPIPLIRLEDGDRDASVVITYGREPYFPALVSCHSDLRILFTEKVGWGSKSLFQANVDMQRPWLSKSKCMKKTATLFSRIPKCEDLR